MDIAVDKDKYLSLAGSLSYLVVGTRPDLAYAVNLLSRFTLSPDTTHWKGLHHLLGYIAGTRHLKLTLRPCKDSKALKGFCDASWGGGEISKSTHGILITFLNCPIVWIARRQSCVASPTCHAKNMALGVATRQILWIKNLIADILRSDYIGHLYCDNKAAIKIVADNVANKRTRHTERDFHIANEALYKGQTTLCWVRSEDQLADVLTKPLGQTLFAKMRESIQVL